MKDGNIDDTPSGNIDDTPSVNIDDTISGDMNKYYRLQHGGLKDGNIDDTTVAALMILLSEKVKQS